MHKSFCRYWFLFLLTIVFQFLAGGQLAVAQESGEQTVDEQSDSAIELNSGLLSAFKLRSIGPALLSGRISDIAVNPSQPSTWYVAAGSGNLWKTTNAGTTWSAIFENYKSYSIGCVTIDPKNPNIVWVGTGEDVGGRHVGFGDGVYVSYDAGGSFQNMGLSKTEHIAKILIHADDSNVILVAAQGPLWKEGGQRGLYRSDDGGKSWNQVLAAGPWTGCTDVVADPADPQVLYAALHQRHRTVAALLNTGPESGIYKSVDGGATWSKLERGLPGDNKGKIALAVSPQKSNVVYASIELPATKGGTWRSEDYGASWKKVSDFVSGGTGPHYYQEMWADPHRFGCLYHANNYLVRSLDGGETWEEIEGNGKHSDNDAIAFHPNDPEIVICGTDGGVYTSHDFAQTWRHIPNLPLTQFYKVDVDNDSPFYHIIGGTQDNSTQYGPSRTRASSGIVSSDWIIPIGGDGHDNAIHPENPDIIFCESQEGYIRRFDRRTGQSIAIRPAPAAGEPEFRFNWDSPILISPHNPNRLYFASNHLHRSDNLGDSWTTISPDLSRNENRLALEMMGRKHGVDAGYDLYAMSQYGNITSISESPVIADLIYVGTDDGLIQVTEDGGQNWRKVERIYGVPEKAFINDIKADRHDADTVYACLDNHKEGDFKPYLIRSRDRGRTWESMTGGLPEKHLVWRFEQDHETPELMFLATEFGLFVSLNAGTNWIKLNNGIPTIPVRDLAIQKRQNDLVCATFGRGFYVLDDYSPLRKLSQLQKAGEMAELIAPRTTAWYQQTNVNPTGFRGNDYYTAENPPLGAMVTVYVRESFETAAEKRKQAEAEAAKANQDVEIPSFEKLAEESAEEKPVLVLEIRDSGNELVQRVPCPTSKGLHRVVWNMTEVLPIASSPSTLVAPGTYSAQLVSIDGGEVKPVGTPVSIDLAAIFEPTLPPVDREETRKLVEETGKLLARWRHVSRTVDRLGSELGGREKLVRAAADAPADLLQKIVGLEDLQRKLNRKLEGDSEKRSRFVVDEPTAGERLQSALYQMAQSSHGPTGTSREQVEIAKDGVVAVEADLQQYEDQLKGLRDAMTDVGLVWIELSSSLTSRVFVCIWSCTRLTMRHQGLAVWLTFFVVGCFHVQASAEELRYKLEPGKSHAYTVTIVVETPTAMETMSGVFAITGKQAGESQFAFSYSGGLSKTTKLKASDSGLPFGFQRPSLPQIPGVPFSQADFRGLVQSSSELVLSDTGEVISMTGNTQLPYLLGNLSLLPFEALPEQILEEWKLESTPTITSKDSDDDWRFGRFGPWGSSKQERIKTGGDEVTSYKIQDRQGSLVTIAKTYLLVSPSTGGDDTGFRVEGTGTWVFDADLGISESMDFKSQITLSENNTDVRVPVTIQWNRITQAEYDKIITERKEKAAAMRKEAEERMAKEAAEKKALEGKELDAKEKREILADLDSTSWPNVAKRLRQMKGFVPHPNDFDIALKIKELRSHKVVGVSLPAKQLWDELEKVIEADGGAKMPVDETDNPFATAEEKNLAAGLQMRQWSDNTGTFKVEAKFLRLEQESVVLMRKDGKQLEVPYGRLSSADQKLVDVLDREKSSDE